MTGKSLAVLAACLVACAAGAQDRIDVRKFQPPITHSAYPDVVVSGWSFNNNVRRTGIQPMSAQVPAYGGTGSLIASWNPQPDVSRRPTFVLLHGGHGVSPGNFQSAQWLFQTLRANVLILDSYLSRGRQENWRTWNEFGANLRVLDAIAAGRYVASLGADPGRTFILGDSQGGWATLRAFTAHGKATEVRAWYAGGIALYPNCHAKESLFAAAPNGATDPDFAPPLGPYTAPLLVLTGSEDAATPISQCNVDKALRTAQRWVHFQGATHAWDAPNRGAGNKAVDGECARAPNEFNRFAICRSDRFTQQTYEEIAAFVARNARSAGTPAVTDAGAAAETGLSESEFDRRTQEILDELAPKQ